MQLTELLNYHYESCTEAEILIRRYQFQYQFQIACTVTLTLGDAHIIRRIFDFVYTIFSLTYEPHPPQRARVSSISRHHYHTQIHHNR
jgi:hypothetical protein